MEKERYLAQYESETDSVGDEDGSKTTGVNDSIESETEVADGLSENQDAMSVNLRDEFDKLLDDVDKLTTAVLALSETNVGTKVREEFADELSNLKDISETIRSVNDDIDEIKLDVDIVHETKGTVEQIKTTVNTLCDNITTLLSIEAFQRFSESSEERLSDILEQATSISNALQPIQENVDALSVHLESLGEASASIQSGISEIFVDSKKIDSILILLQNLQSEYDLMCASIKTFSENAARNYTETLIEANRLESALEQAREVTNKVELIDNKFGKIVDVISTITPYLPVLLISFVVLGTIFVILASKEDRRKTHDFNRKVKYEF